MVRAAVRNSLHGWLERSLVLASLLVLAVLLGHQLVMASPQHAADMAMDRGQIMGAAEVMLAVAVSADDHALAPAPGDRQPSSTWMGCFSQDGILPTLLLLPIIAVLWWRSRSMGLIDALAQAGRRVARSLHPPPLEPSRRRALLQVFLN